MVGQHTETIEKCRNSSQKSDLVEYDKTLFSLGGSSSELRDDFFYDANGRLKPFAEIESDMEGIVGDSEPLSF